MAMRARILVALAAALTAVYIVLPASAAAEAIRVVAPAIGIGAVWVGMATHQPRRVLAWVLVAVSLGLLASRATGLGAALLRRVGHVPVGRRCVPPRVGDRCWSSRWRCWGRTRRPTKTRSVRSRQPSSASPSGSASGSRSSSPTLPTGASRSVTGSGRCSFRWSMRWRSRSRSAPRRRTGSVSRRRCCSQSGVGLLLLSDVARGIAELRGSLGAGGLFAALSIAPPIVIGAAALDPTMTHRNRPAETAPLLGFGRVVWLSVAALTPLTVLLTLESDRPRHAGDADDRCRLCRGGRRARVDAHVATRRHRARTHRTQGPGSIGGDGRALQRCRAARRRRRRDELCEPWSGEHARPPAE